MTEQTQVKTEQAMTLAKSGKQSVQVYGDDRAIAMEIRALKTGLPNMQNRSDAEIAALVIAAKWSGLSPYRGEIYLVPEKGVTVASKIKATDAVTAAQRRGDSLQINFFQIVPSMTDMWSAYAPQGIEANDCVVVCEIISSKARADWFRDRLHRIDELKALGYARKEMESVLREEYPSAPVFRSIGIVKAAEDFGDQKKKFVAFSRYDRASKRALTKCLNAHGLTAPDQRQYGGVSLDEPMNDEPAYTITKPESPAITVMAEMPTTTAEDNHESNAAKLGHAGVDSLIEDGQTHPTQPELGV